MCVVQQPTTDRIGDRGLADVIVPALRGQLAGEDCRVVAVSIPRARVSPRGGDRLRWAETRSLPGCGGVGDNRHTRWLENTKIWSVLDSGAQGHRSGFDANSNANYRY